MDQRPNIALYMQHYLAPSMTFIYRQLKSMESYVNPVVFCSDQKENLDKFPFENIFQKRRNFVQFKKSNYYKKIFGNHTLLNTNPQLSINQKIYFSRLIDKYNIKLIHAHFGPSGLEIVDLAKKKNLPLVVTFHGYDASILFTMERYKKNIKKVFDYAHIIAISDCMRDDLIKYGAKSQNTSVIRCGIPTDKFELKKRISLKEKFEKRKEIIFLQVANFVEVKGHQYTIDAFSRFIKVYPNAKLILAGNGPARESMKQLSRKLNLESYIEFPGVVDESTVLELMKKADVFLYHSVNLSSGVKEGLPTALMEAMASGLTVISSAHSAIPELINNGVNGFLVPEKDINAYFTKMLNLKESAEEIRLNARDTILKNFSLSITDNKLNSLYLKMIGG